jgi:hypothetical protein
MTDAPKHDDLSTVRPIGAWVVGAFLLFATLTMWTLVTVIFQARS